MDAARDVAYAPPHVAFPRLLALLSSPRSSLLLAVSDRRVGADDPGAAHADGDRSRRRSRVGSWAKYNMTMGTMPPMTMKMALVNRSAAGNTLEMSVEGGMARARRATSSPR